MMIKAELCMSHYCNEELLKAFCLALGIMFNTLSFALQQREGSFFNVSLALTELTTPSVE